MHVNSNWDVELLLADEYLQSGLCPCCNNASMDWSYDYSKSRNIVLCDICGLFISGRALSHLLHSVEQFEHIVPSWVDDDDVDSWVF